jgi:hypothetical protein
MAFLMAVTDPLLRLVATLESSPAMYLADSGIGSYPGAAEFRSALAALVSEQKDVISRAATIIEQREQPLPQGGFPIAFTAWHDVDLRYLASRVIESLKRQASDFAALAAQGGDAAGAELAGRAEDIARRHADALEQVAVRLRAGLAGQPA